MADKVDVEEQNKVRAALGMQLLPTASSNIGSSDLNFKKSSKGAAAEKDSDDDDSENDITSTLDKRHAAASGNWHKLNEEAEAKKRREQRRADIKKQRDAAQRFAKLEGKGLGEADDDDEDTRSWLLGSKKRQKKIDKKRAKAANAELLEKQNQAQYTDKDLKGKRVGHEVTDFDEGDQILTLKDAAVDASDDEDELENIDMREKERLDERLKLKKRKPIYDPNDMDETGERTILAQYDEEIDGKKSKRFTLDGKGRAVNGAGQSVAGSNTGPGSAGTVKFSLDFLQDDKPVSDYVDASEIKIRKPKKKKDKSKRQKVVDDDDIFPIPEETNGNVDNFGTADSPRGEATNGSLKRGADALFGGDDDDLQASLAMQRKKALKKRKLARPEELARQLREEASATPMDTTGLDGDEEEEGGLVLDETSEFVSRLQRPQVPDKPAPKKSNAATEAPAAAVTYDGEERDVDMGRENRQAFADAESDDNDEEMDGVDSSRVKREGSAASVNNQEQSNTATGLEDEQVLSNGIGAALSLLTERGLLKTARSGDVNAEHRERQRFLHDKRQREEAAERKARLQRERDRASGKFDRMSAREREQYAQYENKHRDQQDSRQMAEIFNREYKPQIELKYVDEAGRAMNQKEAFKHLSHQFHGKGSGKQKTEKRLKKIEGEKKREAMSTLDSSQSTGMNNAAGQTAKKKGEAGVRLQ